MLFFTCKEASRLMSDSLERPLSFYEKCCLYSHLMICTVCRRARKHFFFLQHLGKDQDYFMNHLDKDIQLPDDAKDRIKQTLDDEKNQSD